MASSRKDLTALQTITRRIIIQKARRRSLNRASTACKRMVSGSFPPLKRVLFIFRSLYCTLSVVGEYLALRDGPRWFSQGFTWLDLLRILQETVIFRVRDVRSLWSNRSKLVPLYYSFLTPYWSPTTPVGKSVRFGLFRFRSPLLTESIFLSVPLATEMFQFSRLAS